LLLYGNDSKLHGISVVYSGVSIPISGLYFLEEHPLVKHINPLYNAALIESIWSTVLYSSQYSSMTMGQLEAWLISSAVNKRDGEIV
jgi:hypothetical protein